MRRSRIVDAIDGNHPGFGRAPARARNGLIPISALAITPETMPELSPGLSAPLPHVDTVVPVVFAAEHPVA